ncbi:MAG: protease HtpX [Methylococcaceae bacterium]|nr:protease HtpX [Methylococcaceae bacterium]
MTRILLFLLTNAAILLVISITFSLFGLQGMLDQQGINIHYPSLLIISAIIGMSGSFISLMLSKSMAKKTMGLQIITTPNNATEKWLHQTVSKQSQQVGIDNPEIAIFNSDDVNAFATGMSKNNALVAVSTGLLTTLNRDETEAVLGHEISHIANGDMVTMTLLQGIVNTFVFFFASVIGHLVDRIVFKTERGLGPAYYVTQIIAQIALSILATMIVMWFSRHREFKADAGGAQLAGQQKMINALKALQKTSEPKAMPNELAAFGIKGRYINPLFQSHPPLAERISALRNS